MRVMTPMTYALGATAGIASAAAIAAGRASFRHCSATARIALDPFPVGQCLAEDAARAEHQYEDQYQEGDGVLERRIDEGDRQAFHDAEDQPAQHGAAHVADAA